jgi:hypothetical protein
VKSTVDLSILNISQHAAEQYHERVSPHGPMPKSDPDAYRARGRAIRHLAALLHYARPLEPITDADGVEAHAWKLGQCVALERGGTVTTIYTDAIYLRHMRGDRT